MRVEQRFKSPLRLVAAVIMCSSATACSMSSPAQTPSTEREYVTLLVRNYNWLDAKVYLVTGSGRRRVGTVTSMGRETVIRLPRGAFSGDGECVIAVELIGSRVRYTSPRVFVEAGHTLDLRIQNTLGLSSLSVW